MGEFARRLRIAGLTVHERYGHSTYPIDLAVEDANHRGRLKLAVETDGPGYAGLLSTRDRDRLRVEQLERLGWQHMRIWSTDLFRDPARDVARVVQAASRSLAGQSTPQSTEVPSAPRFDGSGEHKMSESDQDSSDPDRERDDREGAHPDTPADPDTPGDPASASDQTTKPRRRPRLRRVPEQTRDDTDASWGEHGGDAARDRWLHEERPPHWD